MLSRITIDQRRIQGILADPIAAVDPGEGVVDENSFGSPSLSYTETIIKLFLKTSAKIILFMPYLMNSVGVVTFVILVVVVGALGYLKTQILLSTSRDEKYYNYGRLLKKAFKANYFYLVTLVECTSYLIEYGFIVLQVVLGLSRSPRSSRLESSVMSESPSSMSSSLYWLYVLPSIVLFCSPRKSKTQSFGSLAIWRSC